jgi:hypothetical protein
MEINMSVSSINSSNAAYVPQVKAPAETGEAQKAGREVKNDGDSDDKNAAVKAPAPTVNLNGQAVGTLINAVA